MSGDEAGVKNRAARRSRPPRRSGREQQVAMQMMRVYDEGKVRRREDESDADYFKRVREKAQQIQRHQRAAERKAASAARKRNR